MKRIFLSFFIALVALTQADAAKPKRLPFPIPDNEKGMYMGRASTEHPFSMYKHALAEAILEYNTYLNYKKEGSSQVIDSGNVSIKVIKSYVKNEEFVLLVEIKPGTDYSYSVSSIFQSNTAVRSEGEYTVTENKGEKSYKVKINSGDMNDILFVNYTWDITERTLKK